ncbi:MAG: hypothetical protein MMC33_002603 [Icmadophila ericetorum]|nr:hypothetical protein [Icmadophila ericetorum]
MAANQSVLDEATNNEQLFERLEAYPWDSDTEFQSGLRAILGPNPSPEQAEQLTLRAQCFYYTRQATQAFLYNLSYTDGAKDRKHGVPIDFTAYQTWHTQHGTLPTLRGVTPPNSSQLAAHDSSSFPTPSPGHGTNGEAAPYPISFNHIVDLITSGKPVPGIKDIPDTVLEGQASEPTKPKRRKPWEKDAVN